MHLRLLPSHSHCSLKPGDTNLKHCCMAFNKIDYTTGGIRAKAMGNLSNDCSVLMHAINVK